MKKIIILLALTSDLGFTGVFEGGQRSYLFKDSSRNRSLQTFVWYPAATGAKPSALKKLGPFAPVVAAKDAGLNKARAKYPVVLLSHGSGGTSDKLFWATEKLVQSGIVVIAVNHTGKMTGDSSGKGLLEVWKRPTDLTFALDQVMLSKEFKDRLVLPNSVPLVTPLVQPLPCF